MTDFAKRRKELAKKIGAHGIIILKAAPIAFRNHYHEFSYRQNSDFYYLTGFEEPDAVLVIAPQRKEGEFILFNRIRDRDKEIWEGHRAGQEGAVKTYGANQAFAIENIHQLLPDLMAGRETVHCAFGQDPATDELIMKAINTLRGEVRQGMKAPHAIADIRPTLHEMRVIKSAEEIVCMRKAANIAADGHIRAMQACRPGMYEYELEAELTYAFLKEGARAHAYTPIVGSGANSCILHYVTNQQKIKSGDMVLIDAGAEYQCYASDVTRTFPANGGFSAEQRAIYEIVLAAQLAGIKAVRPGTAWPKIEEITVKVITQGLKDIGLLKGNVDGLIEQKAYFKFYMHRSGHWLGLDTHDAGSYKIDDKWRRLLPGMVRTVEPGIYIAADIPGVPKRWHNIGVRIEDDILVTANGNEVLSQRAPKTIADIEALMTS